MRRVFCGEKWLQSNMAPQTLVGFPPPRMVLMGEYVEIQIKMLGKILSLLFL